MHRHHGQRLIVRDDGAIVFVDPDPSMLPVIKEFAPSFSIVSQPLPGFSRPRLLDTAVTGSGVEWAALADTPTDTCWLAHETALRERPSRLPAEASLLALKSELAQRMLRRCELCGLRCAVDRTDGRRGRCGLGQEALVYEAYVHIAEEPPINPSLNVALRGCGLRCRYCQQSGALRSDGPMAEVLGPATWEQLDCAGARSLSFVGGNPTESLPAVLRFLGSAPADFGLPVVWNSSGFDSVEALRLLDGVCDAFVPDCKYGNDQCAANLSEAPGYTGIARTAIAEMCRQGVPVFVRMLVLPGHANCCHLPSLELLAPWREQIDLNVLSQYLPDSLIGPGDGELARRVPMGEVEAVRAAAERAGFRLMPPAWS